MKHYFLRELIGLTFIVIILSIVLTFTTTKEYNYSVNDVVMLEVESVQIDEEYLEIYCRLNDKEFSIQMPRDSDEYEKFKSIKKGDKIPFVEKKN